MKHSHYITIYAAMFAGLSVFSALAQGGYPSQRATYFPPPAIGSQATVTADPPVSYPSSKPCVVSLFSNVTYNQYDLPSFTYAGPGKCRGPWAKIILKADWSVDAGIQYDREAGISIGGVELFHGTTPEPLYNEVNTWHTENDVTEYAALLQKPNTGVGGIGNPLSPGLQAAFHGSASLYFYPADWRNPPARIPDAVYPLPGTGASDESPLNTITVTLPRNVEEAYLDITARGNGNDEDWWNTFFGTNPPFREIEITIDGNPAGAAPCFPYIYSGGLDPGLWTPIPEIQTVNFRPWRVNLTPFAGLLSNGESHTIAMSIVNNQGFDTAATLLIYQDHGRRQVTGATTVNTLTATPVVNQTPGQTAGFTVTASKRNFQIAGWVNTSHGRVTTTLHQTISFYDNSDPEIYTGTHNVNGTTQTITRGSWSGRYGGTVVESDETWSYPFTYAFNTDEETQQTLQKQHVEKVDGWTVYTSSSSNSVTSGADTSSVYSSQQTYAARDSNGYCYSRALKSSGNAIDAVTDGAGCRKGW